MLRWKKSLPDVLIFSDDYVLLMDKWVSEGPWKMKKYVIFWKVIQVYTNSLILFISFQMTFRIIAIPNCTILDIVIIFALVAILTLNAIYTSWVGNAAKSIQVKWELSPLRK